MKDWLMWAQPVTRDTQQQVVRRGTLSFALIRAETYAEAVEKLFIAFPILKNGYDFGNATIE